MALLFDLSAAFDTLDVDLIAAKLDIYVASPNVLKLIRSDLSGRKQCVDYEGERSNTT